MFFKKFERKQNVAAFSNLLYKKSHINKNEDKYTFQNQLQANNTEIHIDLQSVWNELFI